MKRIIYTLACLMLSVGAWAQNVAKIGETEYATLADAVTAVPTDGTATTITMLENVDLGTAYITIPATKNVVLELNGKNLSGTTTSTNATINVAGTLTINGEGIISSSTRYVIKPTTATSAVILNGGTLKATAANYAAVYASKGTFTMNNGIVSASSHAIEGNVVIKGGTVTSTNGYGVYATSSSGECVIEGGNITGAPTKGAVGVSNGNVKVTSGASLNSKIAFSSSATGLILPETATSHIDNNTANLAIYDDETLQGYATAYTTGTIASGKTVKVIADITTNTTVILGANKLDLNGHNITSTSTTAITVKEGKLATPHSMTITGDGTVSCDNGGGCNVINVQRYCDVTIEDGNYIVGGDADNAVVYIAGSNATNPTKVTITGGYFESGDGKWIVNCNDDAYKNGGAIITIKGGSFSADPSQFLSEGEGTNFLDEEYKPVLDSEGHYSVIVRDFVAQIGDVKYESLAEAVEAAQNGETVTLLADVTDNITIPAGKNITLDLGEHTLNGKQTANTPTIKNLGTLTVKNGNVRRSGDGSASWYIVENEGTITMDDGLNVEGSSGSSLIRNNATEAKMTINAGTYNAASFIVVKNDLGNVVINGGTFTTAESKNVLNNWDQMTINGGTFTGNIFNGAYDTDNNKLTINDGTFNASQIRTYLGNGKTTCPIEIKGGKFTNAQMKYVGTGNKESDTDVQVAVSGGTFANPVPEQYCAEGFSPVTTPDSEGMYTVETTKVAMIGDARYASLAEAIAAASDGSTIKLIRDGWQYEYVEPNKVITLDLNGFTYDCNIDNYGTLTIVDNSEEGTGKLVNTKKHWIVWNNPPAKLTVQSGTIAFETRANAKSDTGQQAVANEGSLIINGGTIDGYTADYNTGIADSYTDTYAVENIGGDVTINGGKLMGLHGLSTFGGTSAVINDGQFIVPFGPGTNAVYNYTDDLTVFIKGGTFIGDTDYLINKNDNSNGSFCITGGKFYKYDPQHSKSENPIANFVPKEYAAQKDADGYYVIVPAIAYIDEMGYAVLDIAIEEAKEAESATTITLLTDAETEKETLPANVTINANSKVLTMPSFVVRDGEAFTLPNITGADTYKVHTATYIRTNVSSTVWGTVCLPFSLTTGNGATYYTFGNINESTLTVNEATSVNPNTPVVFKKGTGDLTINETNATVSLNATPVTTGALVGTYESTSITANGSIYFINGDTFHRAQVSVKVPAYRAYINISSSSGAKPSVLSIMVAGNTATAIETLDADATVSAIYDAAGRKISAPQKGMNIMKLANGKTIKVMMK